MKNKSGRKSIVHRVGREFAGITIAAVVVSLTVYLAHRMTFSSEGKVTPEARDQWYSIHPHLTLLVGVILAATTLVILVELFQIVLTRLPAKPHDRLWVLRSALFGGVCIYGLQAGLAAIQQSREKELRQELAREMRQLSIKMHQPTGQNLEP